MPIYDYKCNFCQYSGENIAKPDEEIIVCPQCKGTATRQFHSRFGINMGVGAHGYFDENLGAYIGSNREKKKIMQEQGVSERYGKGWR